MDCRTTLEEVQLLEEELRLVFEAEEEAKEILAKAERNVARIKEEERTESEDLISSSKEQARKEGDKIISQRISDAEKEGAELRSKQREKILEMKRRAASKMQEAVDTILTSIIEGK